MEIMEIKYSDLITRIDKRKLKEIVVLGLSSNAKIFNEIKRSIPKTTVIRGFSSITKIGFKSYKILINVFLGENIHANDKTARLLFKGFYFKKKDEIALVKTALQEQGYKIVIPNFKEDFLIMDSLERKDVLEQEDRSYYRPNGEEIIGVDKEDASIIAELLGWFVNEDSDAEVEEIKTSEAEPESEKSKKNLPVVSKEQNLLIIEQNIVTLQAEFLKASDVYIKIAEDLKNGELPINYIENNEIAVLKSKIDTIKKELKISNEIEINSIAEIKDECKNSIDAKNQELYDQVLDVLNIYRKIYHTKGKVLPFKKELDKLAKGYNESILANDIEKDEEWLLKLIGGEHLYNYLIKTIELSLDEDFDENLLDSLLEKLEVECKKFGFTFYKPLETQINRGNLAFKEDNSPPDPDNEVKNEISEDSSKEEKSHKIENLIKEEKIEFEDELIEVKTSESLEKEVKKIEIQDIEAAEEIEIINNEKTDSDAIIEADVKESIEDEKKKSSKDIVIFETSEIPKKKILVSNTTVDNIEKETKEDVEEKPSVKKEVNLNNETFSDEDQNILNLLEKDEAELAYHLALCYENDNKNLYLPSWLLQNLFLSPNVRSAVAPISQKIISNLENYNFEIEDSNKGNFINQIIFASILRPSLFAYSYGFSGVLDNVRSGEMKEFSEIKTIISDFMQESGGILNFDRLVSLSSEVEIKESQADFCQKV